MSESFPHPTDRRADPRSYDSAQAWEIMRDRPKPPAASIVTRIADAVRDARAVELDRMARHRLVAIVREHGGMWVTGGPECWSKDELVTEILSAEFPEVTR